MATRWVVRAEPQQGSPSFPLHSSAHEQNAHAISHHFLAPIFDPPICPFFFPSCPFFSLLFSCSHRKRVALQVAREKGKGITTPMRNGRCFHALVVWYWEKKEKTIEHVKDNQPSLLKYRPEEGFWELPSEKRKSLYAQSFGNKPEHRAMHLQKRERERCVGRRVIMLMTHPVRLARPRSGDNTSEDGGCCYKCQWRVVV